MSVDAEVANAGPKDDAGEIGLRRLRCDMAITKHAAASMGAGFIPLPLVDFAAVAGVQLSLLYRLCRIYEVPFSTEAARSLVASLAAGAVPGGLQPLFLSSAVKVIPGVGTAVGQYATPVISAAATYAIGVVFLRHLESGGTLLDFSAQGMKEHFEKALVDGRQRFSGRPKR